MNPAAVLSILVNANTSQATAALTKTQTQLKATETQATRTSGAIGGKLASAAKVGGAALGVGLVYGMAKAVKVGSEFEKQMDSLGAVTQASTKDMARFEKQALRLGQKTAYSASEAAAAQIELAKGGLAVKDILGGALPAALNLAAAGELELADAAETTVNAMQLFGLKGKEAAKVADTLATAANTTTADVADFAMALKQGGSAAQAAGYDLNQTVVVLEALAKAGIKNSDAGTSMKAAFLQLLAPTEKQVAAAESLNLQFVNQAGNLKNAAALSNELRGALDGMTNAQRVAALKTLAGTDGFRALNALYEAGAEKLRDYSKANQETGTAQDIAAEKMDNLRGDVENLSGAMETIGIVIYQKVQPALRDVTQAAADAATAFGKLLQGKGNIPQWAKDLGDSFSALGRGLKGVWEDVIQPIIRTLGPGFKDSLQAAARAVKGGVDIIAGILTLDLGRAWQGVKDLFGGVGGYFVAVFKGAAAVVVAPVKALAKALTGPISAAVNALKRAVVFAFDKILGAVSTALNAIADAAGAFDWLPGVGGKLGDFADAARGAAADVDGFRESIRGNQVEKAKADALGHVEKAFNALGDVAGVNEKRLDRAMDGMRSSLSGAIDKFKDFTNVGDKAMDGVGDSTRDLGKRGSKNLDGLRKLVDNLGGAWGKGLDLIGGNTKNLLSKLKVNFDYSIEKGGKTTPIDKGAAFLQRGGPINMGAPSGDSVPAMLERGEYVLNRNAVAAIGKNKLDAINFNHAARFQSGGVVEQALGPYSIGPIQYDANHAGSNSHLHLDFFTQQQAIAYGKKMQQMGWNIGEYSGPYGGFKGLTTTHQSPGHYDGTAFDANTDADETQAEVAAVAKLLGSGVSGAMVDKIKRVLLKGKDGPLKSGGQAALDRVRNAANALIKRETAASVGGGVNAGSYSGPLDRNFGAGDSTQISFNQAAMLAEKAGLPGITYAQIAIGESNLTPGAVSPDGGYGLWQMTPRVQSAATVAAWENIGTYFNPWNNAQQAKYLAGSGTGVSNYYGIGAVTDWNKHYTGPMKLQQGGLVGMQQGGSVGNILDLYSKLGKVDSNKRAKKIENRIKREQKQLRKKQDSRLHKKLGRIKDVGIMSNVTEQINSQQEKVDVLTDYVSRMEGVHGYTDLRDVSTLLSEAGIDPDAELYTLSKEQQDALKAATGADVAREKGEISAEIQLNYGKLVALMELRFNLINAIEEARERMANLRERIEKAVKAQEQARKDARSAEHTITHLEKTLKSLREEEPPKRRKNESKKDYDARLKSWRRQHGNEVDRVSTRLNRQRFTLSQANQAEAAAGRIASISKESSDKLSGLSGEWMGSLETVQGKGSPMAAKVALLPYGSGMPQFGGDILAVQDKLYSLGASNITAPTLDFTPPDLSGDPSDPSSPSTPGDSSDNERTLLQLEKAMDTIRRLNVGIAQNAVFQGAFASGGVVPGRGFALVGERGPELMAVNGGERIYSNSASQSMLKPEVRVVLEDNRTIVTVDGQVEAIVDNKLNQIARGRSYAGAGRI